MSVVELEADAHGRGASPHWYCAVRENVLPAMIARLQGFSRKPGRLVLSPAKRAVDTRGKESRRGLTSRPTVRAAD